MMNKPENADFYGWDKFVKIIKYVEDQIDSDEDNEFNDLEEKLWSFWKAGYIAGVNN